MPSPHNPLEPSERNRLPTLFEVLNLRTRAPVDLWSFYVFMREQYRGVEYLDFWLDVVKHLSLCRDYVRGIRQSQLTSSSRESSVLLDNLVQDGILGDSDSHRLSAFLRGEDPEQNHPSFSRLSALIDSMDQNRDPQHQLRHQPSAQLRQAGTQAAFQQPPQNLQQPHAAESADSGPLHDSNRNSAQYGAPLQPPNTSAIAAAWAQEKRRTSGSPIRVVLSDSRESSTSRPNSVVRDAPNAAYPRTSSIYDDAVSPSLPHPPATGGVSLSAPLSHTSTVDASSSTFMTPASNRQQISSSLYDQGLAATPQMPQAPMASHYGGSSSDVGRGIPATATFSNPDALNPQQQQLENENTRFQQEHQQHHINHRNGGSNFGNGTDSSRASHNGLISTEPKPQRLERGSQGPEESLAMTFISRSDIKQSTHYILVTYFIPGAEREIVLPQRIMKSVRKAIEEDGRDDPEVFDEAREYVFQAMQQEAFRAFLAAKALGNTTPFGSIVRLIIGLLSTFAAFWVGFILIFLDWQPKSYRLFLIIPFAFASYGIASGLYNLDPLLALFGYSEIGPGKMIRIREPYVRRLLIVRALFVTALIIVVAACFVIIFALVPGRRL